MRLVTPPDTHHLIFRGAKVIVKSAVPALAIVLLLGPVRLEATELKVDTLEGWTAYVKAADAQMADRAAGRQPFLWIDEADGRSERVRKGGIIAFPTVRGGVKKQVPHGAIYDWFGAEFVPNATLEDVFTVVDDYNRYNQIYRPAVVDSRLIERDGDVAKFYLRLAHRALGITAAIDSDYESRCTHLDDRRWYCYSQSTRIQEIRDFGEPSERLLPAGQGTGYLWRLHSVTRFEARDGGVYIEMEAIGLSRDIPLEFRWLVRPITESLPRNALLATLNETRDAVSAIAVARSQKAAGGVRAAATIAPRR
jgi:hypothetical protein